MSTDPGVRPDPAAEEPPFAAPDGRFRGSYPILAENCVSFPVSQPADVRFEQVSTVSLPLMNNLQSMRRPSGYTLLEVLIVVSIVGILAAIAVPSFKYVGTSYRISSEVNSLLGDMQLARSVALKQGQYVTICASSNGTGCVGSGNTWQGGWIIFLDSNNNQTANANEAVLRVQPAFTGGDTFTASTATFWYATYGPGGYAPTGLAAPISLNLHDSTNNAMYTRCLRITQMGTPTGAKDNPPCS